MQAAGEQKVPDRGLDALYSILPVFNFVLLLIRWVDAYRLATDIPLPLPLPWRVLLARYNMLAASTHIYRAVRALRKPTS